MISPKFLTLQNLTTCVKSYNTARQIKPQDKLIMVMVPATRAYLRIAIGLGNDTEDEERANAIIEEGPDDLSKIGELADDEGIKTLCSSVQKPAGTMPHNQGGKNRTRIQTN